MYKVEASSCARLCKGAKGKLSCCTQHCVQVQMLLHMPIADSPSKATMAFIAEMSSGVGRADLVHLISGGGTQAV